MKERRPIDTNTNNRTGEILTNLFVRDPEVNVQIGTDNFARTLERLGLTVSGDKTVAIQPDYGYSVEALSRAREQILVLQDSTNTPLVEALNRQLQFAKVREEEQLKNSAQEAVKKERGRVARRRFLENAGEILLATAAGSCLVGAPLASGLLNFIDHQTANKEVVALAKKIVAKSCEEKSNELFCNQPVPITEISSTKEVTRNMEIADALNTQEEKVAQEVDAFVKGEFFDRDRNSFRNIIRDKGWGLGLISLVGLMLIGFIFATESPSSSNY